MYSGQGNLWLDSSIPQGAVTIKPLHRAVTAVAQPTSSGYITQGCVIHQQQLQFCLPLLLSCSLSFGTELGIGLLADLLLGTHGSLAIGGICRRSSPILQWTAARQNANLSLERQSCIDLFLEQQAH